MSFSFQWRPFLVLVGLAAILLLSWLHPATRSWWDGVDLLTFSWLNGSLAGAGGAGVERTAWTAFWAALNIRSADLIPFVLMLALLLWPGATFRAGLALRGLAGFVMLLVLMLIVREALDFLVETFGWTRPGPSTVIDTTIRLSELYPDWHTKDASSDSFPGDHASVLLTWLGYSLYFVRNRWSAAVALVTLFFMLPRLVSGAHWISDDIVGGGVASLGALALGLYTPILNPILKLLDPLLTFAGNILARLWRRPSA